MAYFPFMIEIRGWQCLIVGGGAVALRKAEQLLGFGVNILAVSPSFDDAFQAFANGQGRLTLIKRGFLEGDIEGVDFVVVATNQKRLNQQVSDLCRKRGILVNAADQKEACSFLFPAIIREQDLLVAVSSGGQSPAAVSYLKKKLKNAIPDGYGKMAKTLGAYRSYILEHVPTAKERKGIFYKLLAYGEEHQGKIPKEAVWELIRQKGGKGGREKENPDRDKGK